MFDAQGLVPQLRWLGAKVVVASAMVCVVNADAPASGPTSAMWRADDDSRAEGTRAPELITPDAGSSGATTDSVAEECVTTLPDVGRVLKRTGPHRFALQRWAIDTYFSHCYPAPTRTTWPPKFGEALTVDAAPGTLWHALGMKTGDELVAVGPMVISANPELMLTGYRQLIREPLQSVALRTRRQGRDRANIILDVVEP